jgi:hypothetical protein
MYEHCVDAYHHYIRLYMRNNYRMKLYKDLIERQGLGYQRVR